MPALVIWLVQGIGIKLIAFVLCLFVFAAGFALLKELLPSMVDLNGLVSTLPNAVLWGLWYVDAPFFMTTVFGGLATAFLIKRLPVIG